jgi:bifunctional oligoribonuclease and PAP phosphatase NrnA
MTPSEANTLPASVERSADLLALLRKHQHFLVTSHARPDGDAIGSALGLMHLLDGMGKRVEVAFADAIPVIYRSLPGADRIHSTDPPSLPAEAPEVAILLECDSIERTGYASLPAGMTVNIDHHLSGRPFADWNWIDPNACAVGSMLYDFAVAARLPITAAAATCLYTAVLTDTGSFTFPCTTSATFALAGHLVECGADAHHIAQDVYFSNPEGKVRILGAALSGIVVQGVLAWTTITLRDMHAAGAAASDCEGVVNYLIGIAGMQAAVVFRELPDAGWRASLRSKDSLDVAAVAERFGGGGHQNASGCTLGSAPGSGRDDLLAALRASLAQG